MGQEELNFFCALFLSNDGGTLIIGRLEAVSPRPGWNLPYLSRRDCKSKVDVLSCDITEGEQVAICRIRPGKPKVVLTPCNFICRIRLEEDAADPEDTWLLKGKWLDRYLCINESLDVL